MEVRMAKKSVKFTLTAEQDSTLRMCVGGHKTSKDTVEERKSFSVPPTA